MLKDSLEAKLFPNGQEPHDENVMKIHCGQFQNRKEIYKHELIYLARLWRFFKFYIFNLSFEIEIRMFCKQLL